MSADEQMDSAQKKFYLKQQFLRRARAEGRGPEALRQLNRLYVNVSATHALSDEDLITSIEDIASTVREDRRAILECLRKTDFEREEDPEIQSLILKDLEGQQHTISILKAMGIPENMLPTLSPAIARLNAYERKTGGQNTWHPDSEKFSHIEKLLTEKPPTNTLN